MKNQINILMAFAIFSFSPFTLFSQNSGSVNEIKTEQRSSRFYAEVNTGLSAGVTMFSGYQFSGGVEFTSEDGSFTQTSVTPKSFGEGYFFGGSIGFKFKENLCFEVGITNHKSTEWQTSYITEDEITFIEEASGKSLTFSPRLLYVKKKDNIEYQIGMGGILGSANARATFYETAFWAPKLTTHFDMHGGHILGTEMTFGLRVPIYKKLSFAGNIDYRVATYTPKYASISAFDFFGRNTLADKDVYLREVIFSNDFAVDLNDPERFQKPHLTPKIKLPFSGVRLRVGLQYAF